jgi:putative FmdB family regulatory protein
VPIYEYLCEGCGRITEVMHKMSERGPSACGECGSTHVARLVSRSAFQLKGGGWYSDLYASRKPGGDAAKPETAAGEPKPAAGGTAETKPPASGAEKKSAGDAGGKAS